MGTNCRPLPLLEFPLFDTGPVTVMGVYRSRSSSRSPWVVAFLPANNLSETGWLFHIIFSKASPLVFQNALHYGISMSARTKLRSFLFL